MSDINLARRTSIEVFFAGTNITKSMQQYLISLSYTDNEEDETDDLQIKLHDRDKIWLEKWLNDAIQAAADTPTPKSDDDEKESSSPYKVTAKGGLAVRSRPSDQYYQYGSLPYGTIVDVKSISGGWANITYDGKNAYVKAEYLTELEKSDSSDSSDGGQSSTKGLRIQAVIVRQNWKSDGKDDVLECGQFSLDDISASGPPGVINIKATSLPYSSTIRQMKKSKSWESYSLSGIANEIADKNGMTCMFQSGTDPSYERVEQYRMSDIEFLKKLCQDNGCSLKVSNNIIIIFDQAEYEKKKTIRTIKYGDGSYTKYKLSTVSNDRYASCRVSCTTNDGKVIQATALVDGYDKDNKDNQCLEIKQTVKSEEEARLLAEKMLRLHNKYEKTATFTLPGDTSLLAGCVVELKKWGAFDGKYIIKQAKHQVSGSGYTTQITLRVALAADMSSGDSDSSSSGGKDLDDIARAVIRGDYGNGSERRRRLTEAGYDYDEVQARVNEIIYG